MAARRGSGQRLHGARGSGAQGAGVAIQYQDAGVNPRNAIAVLPCRWLASWRIAQPASGGGSPAPRSPSRRHEAGNPTPPGKPSRAAEPGTAVRSTPSPTTDLRARRPPRGANSECRQGVNFGCSLTSGRCHPVGGCLFRAVMRPSGRRAAVAAISVVRSTPVREAWPVLAGYGRSPPSEALPQTHEAWVAPVERREAKLPL
jgi:hypothetical protein